MADELNTPAETGDVLGEDEVREVLGFGEEEPQEPPEEGEPAVAPEAAPEAPETQPAPEEKEDGLPVVGKGEPGRAEGNEPQVNPEVERLTKLLETQSRLIEDMQKAQAQPQPKDQPEEDQLPEYNFNVPPQLMQAIESEDPAVRKQGIESLLRGVAMAVHRNIRDESNAFQNKRLPDMVNAMIQQSTVASEVHRDFYGKYPELNQPHLRHLVQQVGAEIMQQTRTTQWSPRLRDAIAARVKQVVQFGPQPSAQPPAPVPPANFGGTPRQPLAPTTPSDDVKDTLEL